MRKDNLQVFLRNRIDRDIFELERDCIVLFGFSLCLSLVLFRMPRTSLPPFLEKLHRITETVAPAVASWSDDGKTFVIHKAAQFEGVLKQHFKGNIQTFIRQLHFYGFRKLDTQDDSWSFAHKYFVKGNPKLLQEIRRKTRYDPTAEGPAPQNEVIALRSRVAFLQNVVEDLCTQLDTVINVLDEAGVAEVQRRSHDRKPLEIKAGNKRQRSDEDKAFQKTCEAVKPVLATKKPFEDFDGINDLDLETGSLGGLSSDDMSSVDDMLALTEEDFMENTDDIDADSIATVVVDTDEFNLPGDSTSTTEVIRSISKATKLDQTSVSKVVDYFKKLSTKDAVVPAPPLGVGCGKSDPMSKSLSDLTHLSFQQLSDSVISYKKPEYIPQLQKVR